MTLALVTGANGHLGANLVRELLGAGQRVRALVRPGADLAGLAGLDVEVVRGDVLDPASLRAAAERCDVVHHTATPYPARVRRADDVLRPAVEGTRNVLVAAREARVATVVCTSSCNVVGFTTDLARPRDERGENDDPRSPYVRAKVQAERVARETARELGLDVVFANPTGVLGRYDYRITPTTQIVLDLVHGRLPAAMGLNAVDVRDVATAHRLLAEQGRSGERYLIGSDNFSPDDVAAFVAEVSGSAPARSMPPRWALMAVAGVVEGACALVGRAAPITRAQVAETYGRHLVFDTTKMREALGLEPAPGRAALDEALRWCLYLGKVSPALAERLRGRFDPPSEWGPAPAARQVAAAPA